MSMFEELFSVAAFRRICPLLTPIIAFVLMAFCPITTIKGAEPVPASLEADVLVFDSTPAGLAAAIAAKREGWRVILLTEDLHLGGMQSSGLGNTNAGQRDTVGGLALEFHNRIRDYYVKKYGPDSQQVKDCSDGFHFEPHVAESVYKDWLTDVGVTCVTGEGIASAKKDGARLVSVNTDRGRTITASIFIDASYEGDLFKLAGCSYRVGREGTKQYGESLAGVRFPPDKLGEPDDNTQAYDYRLCLTDNPDNRVAFRKPNGYDPKTFARQAAIFRSKPITLRDALPLNKMPNRKTDSRTGEWVGASWKFPEATKKERAQIAREHRAYAEGYLWFLITDESVPQAVRDELAKWGLAKDEFTDNDHWPYHIYVREARRLVGDYVMTQKDVTEDRFKSDAVALGSFYLDVHAVQLIPSADAVGGFVAEGGIGNVRIKPYEIPYRALLPKRAEAINLLVPVCLSASHVAYSTVRMEPVYMSLGHASGIAASISLKNKAKLHDLPTDQLQARLRDQKQVFDAKLFTREWPFVKK